jgi:integrase/recombinase XerD
MSGLRARAEEYLAMRRALGFRLTTQGRHLMGFVGFCEDRGAATVTTDLAVEWATTTASDHEAYQARRLDVVRIFARHLQPLDPAAEVPPGDVLDRRQWRIPPYLYSPQEIAALMSAARMLRPAFRAVTWRTLTGLLAVTGMRQGEACRLGRGDVDLNAETVTVRDSKFGKSRMVFLHPTAAAALRAYDRARDEAFPGPEAGTFLVNSRGRPLDGHNLPHTFAPLAIAAGIQAPPGQRAPAARPAPRVHGLNAPGLVPRRRERPGPPPGPVHLARPHRPEVHLLVPLGRPRAARPGRRPARAGRRGGVIVTDLAPVLQGFFTDRLARQKKASPNTVAAYRDTFRLLLAFARDQTGKQPARLSLADIDATLVGAFLNHLEDQRGNGSATRNARLAAIHSLFKYAAPKAPEHAAVISQVLAIPPRRRERAIVSYLTAEEIDALVAAPGREAWHGRRDHALLLLDVQTGLRVSELTGLKRQDIHLGAGPHVRCHGKGRKDRATPLTTQTVKVMRTWLAELSPDPAGPLFPTQPGGRLSRDAVERLVARHAATAAQACPSIKAKHVTPHTLRHSAAMTLLKTGVDTSVIALWLGHEGTETTQVYLHADMTIKEQALARVQQPGTSPGRYRPPDALLAFLDNL